MTTTGIIDESLSASQRLKDMSFKEKLSYIWFYYKWVILGALFLTVAGVILINNYSRAMHVNSILEVTLINSDAIAADESTVFSDFLDTLEDTEGDEVITVDSSLVIDLAKQDYRSAASFQVLSAKLLSGDTDIIVCEKELFLMEQENGAFLPLDEVLSREEMEKTKDLVTVSGKIYGIRLFESVLQDGSIYPKDSELVMGVASTSRDPETAVKLLKWFLD